METMKPNVQGPEKKKLPGWLKVLIGLAAMGMIFSVFASIALKMFFSKKGGNFLAGKALETMINSGSQEKDKVNVDWGKEGLVIQGRDGKKESVQISEKGIVVQDEKGEKAEVKFDQNGLAYKNEKGDEPFAMNTSGSLPAGFPTDIPMYSPSQMRGSMVLGPSKFVQIETASPANTVTEFYKKELASKGWSFSSMKETTVGFIETFSKGNDELTVAVSHPDSPDKTTVVLNYSEKAK